MDVISSVRIKADSVMNLRPDINELISSFAAFLSPVIRDVIQGPSLNLQDLKCLAKSFKGVTGPAIALRPRRPGLRSSDHGVFKGISKRDLNFIHFLHAPRHDL